MVLGFGDSLHDRKKLPLKLERYHSEFRKLQAHFVEAQGLRDELLTAVNTQNWKRAADTKEKLDGFVMARKKSLGPGKESSAAIIKVAEPEGI